MRSLRLGLIGKADVVEFHKHGDKWIPFRLNTSAASQSWTTPDKAQLCAQALCLEEMMNAEIPEGGAFYGETRHRHDVKFDSALRTATEEAAKKLHELIASGITPKAEYSKKCERCSLIDLCPPKVSSKASNYL